MDTELGHNLPNLKITFGNDAESPSQDEDSLQSRPDSLEPESNSHNLDVKIVRKPVINPEDVRIYENKGGAFVTGLDLSSEIVTKKLIDRASRFGLENQPKKTVSQAEIDNLYKSLNINCEGDKSKHIRLDAIHMRGVEEMNTSEVIEYFSEFGPAYLEWINDNSCNVVWLDETGAARALLSLSRVLVVKKKNHNLSTSQNEDEDIDKVDKDLKSSEKEDKNTEEVIFMSDLSSDEDDDDDMDTKNENDDKSKTTEISTPMEVEDMAVDKDIKDGDGQSSRIEKGDGDKDSSFASAERDDGDENSLSPEIPVPPGHWRLGLPHEKAKAILLRFATKDDKKLRGAEKRSEYYRKYGNPNYGGMQGLISGTRKRKMNALKNRQIVEKLSTKKNSEEPDTSTELKKVQGIKRMRMRMHADDEEEKVKIRMARKQRYLQNNPEKRNIHDRLGVQIQIQSRRRSDDYEEGEIDDDDGDVEDDVYSDEGEYNDDDTNNDDNPEPIRNVVKSTITLKNKSDSSRFSIWNRLAESMAQEADYPEPVYRRSSESRNQFGDLRSRNQDGDFRITRKIQTRNQDKDLHTRNWDEDVRTRNRDEDVRTRNRDEDLQTRNRDEDLQTRNKSEDLRSRNQGKDLRTKLRSAVSFVSKFPSRRSEGRSHNDLRSKLQNRRSKENSQERGKFRSVMNRSSDEDS